MKKTVAPFRDCRKKIALYGNIMRNKNRCFFNQQVKLESLTGFTLVELLVAVVILAILVTLAIPTYMRMVERAKQREAIATLNTIYAAERVYRTERQTYVGTNNWANLNIDDPDNTDFSFTIANWSQTAFTIRATRRAGPFIGSQIFINQTGATTQDYNP